MRARERRVVIVALALVGAVSCKKEQTSSSPPAEAAALADAGDDLGEAELRIAENAAQL
ncbi:MAG: hypothetical protein IAG13_06625, partial [Deltaproteobacteria bacterium]|nr:hypothetical protein [Nannocystaceae bacterium]